MVFPLSAVGEHQCSRPPGARTFACRRAWGGRLRVSIIAPHRRLRISNVGFANTLSLATNQNASPDV